jgi:OOP family OmpA-OmpF porin
LYNLSAAGSLVYAGGFYGLSRPVSDSFGIVVFNKEVPGAAVLNNGQEIGKAGSSDTMVVPTLTSYGQNKITLDTKNIPIDYSIFDVNKTISPSLWSGSCVYFDVQQTRALTGTLVMQKEGKKTPLEYVEISVKIGEKNFPFPTGKGGEFYMENILPKDQKENTADNLSCHAIEEQIKSGGSAIKPGKYPASVEFDGGKCEFTITFPDTKEPITDLGEIQCVVSQASVPPTAPVPSVKETPPVPAPVPVLKNDVPAAVEKKQEKVSIILNVQFDNAKSDIKRKYHKYIKKLADFMKAHPETFIEIIGHTDNAGKEGFNMLLSQRRANNVRKYLMDKFGIDASRIHALGYGSNKPIASNKTKEGRRKNNKVEVVIEGLQIQ